MPEPNRPAAVTEPTGAPSSPGSTPGWRRWSAAHSRGLGTLARGLVLAGLLAWAASPFGVARPTVFAEPNAQFPTGPTNPYATSTPYPDPAYFTPTPTPYGFNPAQNGQYVTPAVNQPGATYPGASVTDPNNPYQNAAPPPGGVPGSGISDGAIVPGPLTTGASPVPGGGDPCHGDELITFSPEAPRVGNELLIAVTSASPHPYGRLAGTEPTHFTRERPGQRGIVWEWVINPTYPGQHEYTFYVDSTIPCQKIQLTVLTSLATSTPKPTKTPTPYGFNSNDNNGNNNNDNGSNTSNNGAVPYRDPGQFAYVSYDAYNCNFFYSQGEAQRVLRANPSDPNNLDSEDGVTDGIACTTYHGWQYPNDGDYNPVQRTNPTATQTGSFNPYAYLGQGDRWGCHDFSSQANAQAVLRADPSDPNHLDTNPRNGIACESAEASADGVSGGTMPGPYDYNPVSR